MKPSHSNIQSIAHTFEDLLSVNPNGNSSDSGLDSFFQPMFNGGSSGSSFSGDRSNADPHDKDEDLLAQARQQGYQSGLSAGKHNACQMVQNNMSPIVETVAASLKQWDQLYRSFSQSLSGNCLKLALEIAKKITGKDPQITLEEMADAQAILIDAMESAYRANLQLNPGDLQLLQELSVCEQTLNLGRYESIAVSADDAVASGTATQTESEFQWEEIQSRVASALDRIITEKPEPA